ncbi:diguanylate cyclase (GGDEF) domain-containing protein [Synechococcus sp. PCC 7502]|uniref:putative bifunctional diguanylate cyclase/phosphodiesterase n=1 Tax=Synechococcus sp. PCC 7502 TaxID=1173263 RepID=UPI00029F9CF5|nr:EAL domain-containing protein [Synechococcus sp. PCC 7502]AFY75322.1 diguanylate cyclase (GGDEF) domain-containing protein [Synechococcus sp. PCC 7502]
MTKILVIEDTESLREEIIETLGLEGFEVEGAANGEVGVELAKQYLPDLIICDVMMPELDGYGTLEALQGYPPTATTPFIFLTAKADRVDMRHGMELGANDYLTKPFASSELLGAIAAQLKKIQTIQSQHETAIQLAIDKHELKLQELRTSNDPLTRLPNRLAFNQYLQESILYAQTHQCSLAVILIDIDDFNIVNNSLGHKIGDVLFKAIAERLRRYTSPCDPLARMQGDQFGLILIDQFEPENLKQSSQEILEVISRPYRIFGHEIFVTACMGITIYPQDHFETAGLIKNADMALYYAKSQGRNNYKFYSSNLNTKLAEQMAIENSLHRALERKEFRLYYQPVINSLTKKIIGAEALIRWQHPDIGIVAPNKFIPLAESMGMITPITEWVIEQACKQLKIWQEFTEMYIAINLSTFNFKQDNLVDMITEKIKAAGVYFTQVELEITEGILVQNLDETIVSLSKLRNLGIKIAIDDFGVGFSSLSYLKHFPVDKLKIDKCFVQDMLKDKRDAAITLAIIELAHSLNLGVVAEGVETKEQLQYLQENQCEVIQGYLFSPPLPAEQFTQFLVAEKV